MFMGFIPVLFAVIAIFGGRHNVAVARVLWAICALLVVCWASFHGSHHVSDLKQLGAW